MCVYTVLKKIIPDLQLLNHKTGLAIAKFQHNEYYLYVVHEYNYIIDKVEIFQICLCWEHDSL